MKKSDVALANEIVAGKKPYQWRASGGELFNLKDLPTSRLFYTWLLLWNHMCPEPLRRWYKEPRTFGSFYTDEYLHMSLQETTKEMMFRTELLEGKSDLGKKSRDVFLEILNECRRQGVANV